MQHKGFTLIELMVTIAVLVILLTIAVPSFQYIINSMRMNSEINVLQGNMNFARSEALKRGQNVYVCPSANSSAPVPVCITASPLDWSSGWVVYVGAPIPSAATQTLRISSGVTHGDTLTGGTAPGPVVFSPIGYGLFTGTVSLHDSNDDQNLRRCITFATGTTSIKTGAPPTCP